MVSCREWGGKLKRVAVLLILPILAACGPEAETTLKVLDTSIIRDQLDLNKVKAIVVGDGAEPIVQGDWPRFSPDETWNWQLSGDLNLEYVADVYVVDMFQQLQSNSLIPLRDLGRKAICYFSAGTYEGWREDAALFATVSLGLPHVGFPNERWLDITDPLVVQLMVNRMDMAVAIGCDAVELDNTDGWVNQTGFGYGEAEQLLFNKILANEAHKRGLAVVLKNNVEMIPELVDYFDLVINEECFEYNECEGYRFMVENGKPVFNAEYTQIHVDDAAAREALCVVSRSYGFQTLILPLALDGSFRLSCR